LLHKNSIISLLKNEEFFALTSHAIETKALAELIGDDEENRLGVFQRLQKQTQKISISICGREKLFGSNLKPLVGPFSNRRPAITSFCYQTVLHQIYKLFW